MHESIRIVETLTPDGEYQFQRVSAETFEGMCDGLRCIGAEGDEEANTVTYWYVNEGRLEYHVA